MADRDPETSEEQPSSSMQESWVDVQQGEGKLTHNQSNEELVQQLVSAASEDETSDSDPVYERKYTLTFEPTTAPAEDEIEEVPSKEPLASPVSPDLPQEPPIMAPVQPTPTPTNTQWLSTETSRIEESGPRSQSSCSLFWCVPVIILTHLAMFGIGYYFGRRVTSVESSLKLLHV